MTDTNIGGQSGAGSEAMTRARQAASGTAEAASNLAGQASGLASGLAGKAASAIASEAQHKATGVMQQQMKAGADYVRMVSDTAHTAARELEDKAPELARLVHDVADRADHFADDLRKRNVEDMLDATWDFARHNPRMFLGGAIAAGFLLARFAKSSAENSARRSSLTDRSNRRREPTRSGSDFAAGSSRQGAGGSSGRSPGANPTGANPKGTSDAG